MIVQEEIRPELLSFFLELQKEWERSVEMYGHGKSLEDRMFVIREEYLELEREIMEKPDKRSKEKIMEEAKQLANTALTMYLYAQDMDAK